MQLKRIVEKTDTTAGRVFDLFIQFLIVLSLVSFSIESLPDLRKETVRILDTAAVLIVAIFTIEYLLRLLAADRKLKFVFSFYGLIDLIAILPFYLARGIDLRSLRILRLFRLIRVFKLLKYSKARQRFINALLTASRVIWNLMFILYVCGGSLIQCRRTGLVPSLLKGTGYEVWDIRDQWTYSLAGKSSIMQGGLVGEAFRHTALCPLV